MYRGAFIAATPIQSRAGFEIGLEFVVKAYVAGYRIGEIPTTWQDRVSGTSRFNIRKWLPHYMRWYTICVPEARLVTHVGAKVKNILCLGGAGFIGSYVVRELLNAGYSVTVIDNFSKYGYIEHDFYGHPGFRLEIKDVRTMYPSEFKGYDVGLVPCGAHRRHPLLSQDPLSYLARQYRASRSRHRFDLSRSPRSALRLFLFVDDLRTDGSARHRGGFAAATRAR